MKRLNTKILIIVLFALLAVFVLTKVFRSAGLESNLDTDLLKVDTARITEIKLYPVSNNQRKEVGLLKEGNRWRTVQDQKAARSNLYAVNDLLQTMAGLKCERIVSRKKEKWNAYNLGDTSGIQVQVFGGNDKLADMWIGKESGGQTYVRKADGDEIYTVKGLVQATFNKTFDDLRDKSFLRIDKDQANKIVFNYPADSGFVVQKTGNMWMIENQLIDSAKMENYLNKLRSKNLSKFADDFSPGTNPDVTLTIENDSTQLAEVKAWKAPDNSWRLVSTLQKDTYFSNEGSSLMDDLFKGKKYFSGAGP
jgi:Domain of unknown function (DUF4340)